MLPWKTWNNKGSYTIEAALTLTVFTICVMAVISVISIIKVEGEVQDALNQTALELSQYTYLLGELAGGETEESSDETVSDIGELVLSVAKTSAREQAASSAGEKLGKQLVKSHFSRKNVDEWLTSQGIKNGYAGLDFSDSSLLADQKTIVVSVTYHLVVNTYGLFDKTLTLHQSAVTLALLPENASDLFASLSDNGEEDGGSSSIWKETNFVRGQYFLEQIRGENSSQEVATGSGIDLYDAATGHYVEAVSLNLYGSSYANCSGDTADPQSYTPVETAVTEQLEEYAKKMNQDLEDLGGELEMANGNMVKAGEVKKKTLVVVVPEEAKENEPMKRLLSEVATQIQKDYGIQLDVRYSEEAL